jgi:protein-serine/threonine kinase
MTQIFGGSSSSSSTGGAGVGTGGAGAAHDRKITLSPPSSKGHHSHLHFSSSPGGGSSASSTPSHAMSKFRNFFRNINSSNNSLGGSGNDPTHLSPSGGGGRPKSRFLNRGRSTSSASQLDNAADISPTANANPYFAHQGQPALRHYNHDSAPSSPPNTPPNKETPNAAAAVVDKNSEAGKAELARKLRRVASAPNAQGLFTKGTDEEIPDLPPGPIPQGGSNNSTGSLLVPSDPAVDRLRNQAFRRTYSSNSIKVRNVEVGPGSFDKIKLLGKGDVGKVYLVREKKSSRLYAMKGMTLAVAMLETCMLTRPSVE